MCQRLDNVVDDDLKLSCADQVLLAGDGRAVSSVQSEWGPGTVRTGVVCALYGDSMKVEWCESGKESGWFETGACVLLRGTG